QVDTREVFASLASAAAWVLVTRRALGEVRHLPPLVPPRLPLLRVGVAAVTGVRRVRRGLPGLLEGHEVRRGRMAHLAGVVAASGPSLAVIDREPVFRQRRALPRRRRMALRAAGAERLRLRLVAGRLAVAAHARLGRALERLVHVARLAIAPPVFARQRERRPGVVETDRREHLRPQRRRLPGDRPVALRAIGAELALVNGRLGVPETQGRGAPRGPP